MSLCGASSSPSLTIHRATPRRQETEGKKIQSGVDERKKNQCRITVPSPFHPPLPPPVRLSSVQLWLCDAKLMGAKLGSVHTLAYNALRLIPTHTNARFLSVCLSLTDWAPLSPVSQTPTCTRLPLLFSLTPSLSFGCLPYSFLFSLISISFPSIPHLCFFALPQTPMPSHIQSYAHAMGV